MSEGMAVVVSPNNNPSLQWSGKSRQLPSPYGTGNSDDTNVHVVLDQTPRLESLKIGDTVTVTVQLANETGVLWLPPAAIRQVEGVTFVIVNGTNVPNALMLKLACKRPIGWKSHPAWRRTGRTRTMKILSGFGSFVLQVWATIGVAFKHLRTQLFLSIAAIVGLMIASGFILSIPLYADATYFRLFRTELFAGKNEGKACQPSG